MKNLVFLIIFYSLGAQATGLDFLKNGITTPVKLDTVTPANSVGYPMGLLGVSGSLIDPATAGNQATEITKLANIDASTGTTALILNEIVTNIGNSIPNFSIVTAGSDPSNNLRAMKVDGNGYLGVNIQSSTTLNVAQSGTWNLNNISGTVSLPTGASTAANQSTANGYLLNIQTHQTDGTQLTKITDGAGVVNTKAISTAVTGTDVALVTNTVIHGLSSGGGGTYVDVKVNPSGSLIVDGSGVTQPVSVASLPLPTGAATAANQSTQITSLTSMDGKMADNYGVATGALRTAAQVGNASGAADFGSGTTSAQTLRVVLPTDQTMNAVKGRSAVTRAYNAYSTTSVTTSAYVQLVASTPANTNEVEIFDSSGETLILAVGGAGSEVDQIYILPGGNGKVPLYIPSGSRVSVKALTNTASSGYLAINFYN